jgi:hypothetical protein
MPHIRKLIPIVMMMMMNRERYDNNDGERASKVT